MSDSNYTPHIGPLVPYPDGVPHIDKSFQEEPLHYITESQRNRLLAIEKEAAALREEVGRLRAALEKIAKDAPEERPERGDWNGNADDDYYVGIEIGRWEAGKIARAALALKEEA